MKKLIYGGLFLAIVGIVFVGCQKNQEIDPQIESNEKSSGESLINREPKFSEELIENMVNDAYSINDDEIHAKAGGEKWRRFWRKVGRWFNDHTGVRIFGDCGLNLSCGPCPGLCFSLGIIDSNSNDGDTASDYTYSNGLRVYGIDILEDRETNEEYLMFRFNKDVSDFVLDGFFYIKEDIFLSESMSDQLEKESIQLKEGKYNVYYDEISGYYYSLVDSYMK